ncbi:hypothetical protein QTL95_09225 [Rhizobium sp. S152]|uniref:hypothetical protein n=1 Tax=Rhizobium sp. S152 TaxID=3055038 RepID=UPI0025A95EFB|nr:hypothetical protein [Rhizobium sp. S152]MDM9626077.1 hypothetical protein [Rhizobium sp. S152]
MRFVGSGRWNARVRGGIPATGNAALLVASFGIGQGSLFLAQTWLVGQGAFVLLTHFGVSFSFTILALMLVDCGAVTTIARRIALADADQRAAVIGQCYWHASLFRFCVAAGVSLAALSYVALSNDVFDCAYLLSVLPALFIWAFNAAGVLDGLALGGLSGLTGVPIYAVPALALLFVADQPRGMAGTVLGAALSLGAMLTIALQIAILRRLGHAPVPARIKLSEAAFFAREGMGVLLAVVPGQVSFRFQILVCSLFLGELTTAIFLYGRQITVAFSQVLEFIRRAHFPQLVRELRGGEREVGRLFRTQRLASWLAFLLSLAMLGAGYLMAVLLDGPAAEAALVVALFSVGVFTGAISQTLSQAGQALGRYRVVAWAAGAAMLAGFAASSLFGWAWGLAGLALAEVVTHGVVVVMVWAIVFRRSARFPVLAVSS